MSTAGPAQADLDWIARWQRIARRIRVPLGFLDGGALSFLIFGGARLVRRLWRGAWRWCCRDFGCARMRRDM